MDTNHSAKRYRKGRRFKQRVLAAILSFLMMLMIPMQALAATASVTGLADMGNVYATANGTTYLSKADRTYSPVILWYLNGTSKISYCIDFGHECSRGDSFTSSSTISSLTSEQQLWLKAALYHGFQSGYTCRHGTSVQDCSTCRAQYAATQAVIWLVTDGNYTNASTAAAWGKYVANTVSSGSYYSAIWSYYEALYNNVVATVAIPSFTASSSSSAPTLTMRWDNYNQRYYLYQTDSKGLLSEFTLSGVPSTVTATKGSSYLELKSSSAVSKTLITLKANRTVQTPVWWIADKTDNAQQPQIQYGSTTETVTVTAYAYLQTEVPGKLGIIKHDGESDKVVTGAVYGVYENSSCTTEITSVTTGSSHVYVTLAPGTYYVKEKTAPGGYVKNTDVYSVKVTTGGTVNLTAYDDPWSGTVKVTEKDSTSSTTYVPGAVYALYSNAGCTNLLAQATTGSNGAATFNYTIRYGVTYYVKEISSPDGYKLDTSVYTVSSTALTSNGATVNINVTDVPLYNVTTEVVNGTISNAVYNIEAGGNVTISYSPADGYQLASITVDGVAVSITKYPSSYTFSNINADHHIKVVYERATANITTEVVNGTITDSIYDIPLGEDRTISSVANSGYVLQSVTIDGVAVDVSKYLASTSYGYTFSDIQQDHHIKVVYAAQGYIDLTKLGTSTGKSVAGAEFTIYADEVCTKAVTTMTTNASGYAKSVGLSPGTYWVKETTAPVGYVINMSSEWARVTSGNTYSLSAAFAQNQEWEASFEVTKIDGVTGAKLPGATFALYEWSVSANAYVRLKTMTDDEGIYTAYEVSFTDDNQGKFKVVEEVNPEGYAGIYEKEFSMDLTAEAGTVQSFLYTATATNTKTKYQFIKVDEAGDALAGATLQLYDVTDGVVTATWTTDSTGLKVLEGVLEAGHTYRLRETGTPDGYDTAADITFTVPYADAGLKTITMVNQSGYRCAITITKRIAVDDIIFEHGNPTFVMKVTGTDYNGQAHTFYDVITFTSDDVAANQNGGYVEASVTIYVKPGTYTATEIKGEIYHEKEKFEVHYLSSSNDRSSFHRKCHGILHRLRGGNQLLHLRTGRAGADRAELG